MERIDDCLSIRSGRLFIEDCDTTLIARQFGTPLYVVSEDQLRRNVRKVQSAFAGHWPHGPVRLLPSIKANHSLALRWILTSEGTGCDTFGAGELRAALQCGVPPELISVNGSIKDRALLECAINAGARLTLDSVAELQTVRDIVAGTGVPATVRLRVRPAYEAITATTDFLAEEVPIGTAMQIYKVGIPAEQLTAIDPVSLAKDGITVTGLMTHFGRHSPDPRTWNEMAAGFGGVVADLCSRWPGWMPRELDIGGGLPVPRDPFGRALDRFAHRPPHDAAAPIAAYAEAVTSGLSGKLATTGIPLDGIALEIEPGRALYGDAGIHLMTVMHVKTQDTPLPMRWAETDSSEMFLADSVFEHNRWFVRAASKAGLPDTITADIVGKTCQPDIIVPGARLPDVQQGDLLAVLDTGAYQDACASNFNAVPRPGTVLVHSGNAELVKRAETLDDIFRRDLVPERLKNVKTHDSQAEGQRNATNR
jgi:diaminopimelate decarboxylase